MTIKSRLNKAERAAAIIGRKAHPPRVFFYYEGEEYGNLSGKDIEPQRVRVADFLATARNVDTIIRIVYDDDKPVSNIAGPGEYKKAVGVDMMKV